MKNQRGSALQDTPRRFSKEARLSHHSEYSRPRRPGAQQPSVQRSLLRPIEKMLQFAVEKNMCQQKEQSVRHSLNAEGSSPEGSGCLSSESKLSHHRQGRVTAVQRLFPTPCNHFSRMRAQNPAVICTMQPASQWSAGTQLVSPAGGRTEVFISSCLNHSPVPWGLI